MVHWARSGQVAYADPKIALRVLVIVRVTPAGRGCHGLTGGRCPGAGDRGQAVAGDHPVGGDAAAGQPCPVGARITCAVGSARSVGTSE